MKVLKTESEYNTGHFYYYSINKSLSSSFLGGTLIYGTIKHKSNGGEVYALLISECDLDNLYTKACPEGDLIYFSEDTPNIDNIIKTVVGNKEYNQTKVINGKLHYAFLLESFMRIKLVGYYNLLNSVSHSIIEEQLEKDFSNRKAYTEGIFRLDIKSELSKNWAETFSENSIYIESTSRYIRPKDGLAIDCTTNGDDTYITVKYDDGAQIITRYVGYIKIFSELLTDKRDILDNVFIQTSYLGFPVDFNLNMLVEAIKESAYNKPQSTVSFIIMLASLYLYENPEKLIEYYKKIALETTEDIDNIVTEIVPVYLEKLSKGDIRHNKRALAKLINDLAI